MSNRITWLQPYYDTILNKIPLETKRILDVGAGYGIFGFILKKTRNATIDVVEPFEYELEHYNEIFRETWQDWFKNWNKIKYDVLISTEMIEHLDIKEAEEFLEQAKLVAEMVIIATPITFTEQSDYDHNEFQLHKSLITKEMLTNHDYNLEIYGSLNSQFLQLKAIYRRKLINLFRIIGIKPTNIIAWWKKQTLNLEEGIVNGIP